MTKWKGCPCLPWTFHCLVLRTCSTSKYSSPSMSSGGGGGGISWFGNVGGMYGVRSASLNVG